MTDVKTKESTLQPGSKNALKATKGALPHHKAVHQPPVTASSGGSAKRNIIRRHGSGGGPRKEGVSKFAENDGTLEDFDDALDANDPNFDSPDDPKLVSNFD